MDPLTAIGVGTGALNAVGSFFGGDGQDKVRPMDYVPDYINDIYKQSTLGMYNDLANLPDREYYAGNLTANINKPLDTSLRQMRQYGNEFGGKIKRHQYQSGLEGRRALDKGLGYTSALAQQGPNQFGYDQGTFNQIAGNLMPGLQGAYNAATRDNNRQLNWSTLPGLNMQAAAGGMQGSSKLGQQSALAQSMTADRNADIGANMYMNALNQANQGAMSGGLANLQAAGQHQADVLGGYSQFANLGLPMLGNANQTAMSNIGMKNEAGRFLQQHNQNRINNKMQRWMYNQDQPYNDLTARFGLVNAGLPGGAISPGTSGPHWTQNLANAATAAAGTIEGSGIWGKPQYTQPAPMTAGVGSYDWGNMNTDQFANYLGGGNSGPLSYGDYGYGIQA